MKSSSLLISCEEISEDVEFLDAWKADDEIPKTRESYFPDKFAETSNRPIAVSLRAKANCCAKTRKKKKNSKLVLHIDS